MKTEIKIGSAKFVTNLDNKLIEASFVPSLDLKADDDLIKELNQCDNIDKAETLLANWFEKIDQMQLADRTKFTIEVRIKEDEEPSKSDEEFKSFSTTTGKIAKVKELEYFFKEI